jgi:putative colanic acid biosynthesis UDP-glucose lipid carrier transferase
MIASNRVNYSNILDPLASNGLTDYFYIRFYLFEYQIFNIRYYIIYLIIGWCVVAILIFYNVYRFTALIEIISKIIKQGLLFLLSSLHFSPF